MLFYNSNLDLLSNSQATEERYKNKGAYIVLEPPNFDAPIFHSFEAVTPRPKVKFPTKPDKQFVQKMKIGTILI